MHVPACAATQAPASGGAGLLATGDPRSCAGERRRAHRGAGPVWMPNANGAELPYVGGGKQIANHLGEIRSSLAFAGWQLVEG